MKNKESTFTTTEKIVITLITVVTLLIAVRWTWTNAKENSVKANTTTEVTVKVDATEAPTKADETENPTKVDVTEEHHKQTALTIENVCATDNEDEICQEAIVSYLEGRWDGTEMTYKNHKLKLRENDGQFLFDGACKSTSDLEISVNDFYRVHVNSNLDIPSKYISLFNNFLPGYAYVPGEGTYAIVDKKLVRFERGEKIELTDYELSWEGFSCVDEIYSTLGSEKGMLVSYPTLYYNKNDGKLYFFSADSTCTIATKERYIYVFDENYNMYYLGKLDVSNYMT